ncbi:unnamed protein product [Vitrella brassicaformis CCMP3155]|uniref:N-acetyltransferase domain-containing protein n=1 Tax=Vitrella brassicaformis (strain CCMP3155) TaxID=1169540 RepID=A0A0G4EY33_VITBC|nr:unnamed protein product [Vitrella brassicaformis CCMP3155]|eukprot:CEM03335.1 unnamed protein product [Vitrella brassicaformis CCMP3155]
MARLQLSSYALHSSGDRHRFLDEIWPFLIRNEAYHTHTISVLQAAGCLPQSPFSSVPLPCFDKDPFRPPISSYAFADSAAASGDDYVEVLCYALAAAADDPAQPAWTAVRCVAVVAVPRDESTGEAKVAFTPLYASASSHGDAATFTQADLDQPAVDSTIQPLMAAVQAVINAHAFEKIRINGPAPIVSGIHTGCEAAVGEKEGWLGGLYDNTAWIKDGAFNAYALDLTDLRRTLSDPDLWTNAVVSPSPLLGVNFTAADPTVHPSLKAMQQKEPIVIYQWDGSDGCVTPETSTGSLPSVNSNSDSSGDSSGQDDPFQPPLPPYQLVFPSLSPESVDRHVKWEEHYMKHWVQSYPFLAKYAVADVLRQRITESLSSGSILVLQRGDEQPLCRSFFRMSEGGVAEVGGIMTWPQYQGKGYAKVITAAQSLLAFSRGFRVCRLMTEASNGASNHIYSGLGYRCIGRPTHLELSRKGTHENSAEADAACASKLCR